MTIIRHEDHEIPIDGILRGVNFTAEAYSYDIVKAQQWDDLPRSYDSVDSLEVRFSDFEVWRNDDIGWETMTEEEVAQATEWLNKNYNTERLESEILCA